MAKEIIKTDYRVEIRPNTCLSDQKAKIVCLSIEEQVRRHIDDFGSVSVEWTTLERCSFCKHPWADCVEADGEPVCCSRAGDEYDKQTGKVNDA